MPSPAQPCHVRTAPSRACHAVPRLTKPRLACLAPPCRAWPRRTQPAVPRLTRPSLASSCSVPLPRSRLTRLPHQAPRHLVITMENRVVEAMQPAARWAVPASTDLVRGRSVQCGHYSRLHWQILFRTVLHCLPAVVFTRSEPGDVIAPSRRTPVHVRAGIRESPGDAFRRLAGFEGRLSVVEAACPATSLTHYSSLLEESITTLARTTTFSSCLTMTSRSIRASRTSSSSSVRRAGSSSSSALRARRVASSMTWFLV